MPASPASSTSWLAPVIASPQHSLEQVQLARAADQRVAVERGGERDRPGDDGDPRARREPPAPGASPRRIALVRGQHGRAGRGAELVAQQDPQLLERAQRLGRVAGRLVHLHQQPVRGLAERRRRDRGAGGLLGGAQLAPALAQAGLGERLQRAHAQAVELAPELVHPRAVAVGQEGLQVDRERVARVARRPPSRGRRPPPRRGRLRWPPPRRRRRAGRRGRAAARSGRPAPLRRARGGAWRAAR